MKTWALLLLSAVSTIAVADEGKALYGPVRQGWYSQAMFTYLFPDEQRFTGQGKGVIAGIGHHGEVASIEASFLWYSGFKYADEPRYGGKPSLLGGQLALVMGLPVHSPVLSRFVGIVGLGGFQETNMPGKAADGSGLFGDVGLGYRHPLELFGIDALLRTEVRYRADYQMAPRQDWEASYFRDWLLNVGLQIPLSPKPPEAAPAEPPRVVPPVEPTAQPDASTAQPAPEEGAAAPAESGAPATSPPPQ